MLRDDELETMGEYTAFSTMDMEAMDRNRIRVRGPVALSGDGHGRDGRARLRIQVGDALVEVTANPTSALAMAGEGSHIELAVTLTGMMDISRGVYYARDAHLLNQIS